MANKPSFVLEEQATAARELAATIARSVRENEEIPTSEIETFAATHSALDDLFDLFDPFETMEDVEQVFEWLGGLLAEALFDANEDQD